MGVRMDLMRCKTRAVGRFRPEGPLGYRSWSDPDAPLRGTRQEAEADQRTWWDTRWAHVVGDGA